MYIEEPLIQSLLEDQELALLWSSALETYPVEPVLFGMQPGLTLEPMKPPENVVFFPWTAGTVPTI